MTDDTIQTHGTAVAELGEPLPALAEPLSDVAGLQPELPVALLADEAEPEPVQEPAPVSEPPRLDRTLPLRTAMAQAFEEELALATAQAELAADRPVEAVHAFRKSLRRARAMVRLVRGALPKATYATLARHLGEVSRSTSALRDAEVLPDALRSLEAVAGKKAWREIERELDAMRGQVKLSGQAEMLLRDGAEHLAILPAVLAAGLRPDLEWQDLGDGLRETYRRARKAKKAASKHPNFVLIHDWRKRSKDLRHQLELLAPEDDYAAARPYKHLAQALGHVTDLIALRQWVRRTAALDGRDGHRKLLQVLDKQVKQRFQAARKEGEEAFGRKARRFVAEALPQAQLAVADEGTLAEG